MAVAEVSIKQLAKAAGIPIDELFRQLAQAGISIKKQDSDQTLSKEQRDLFLAYKRSNLNKTGQSIGEKSTSEKRITLKRKEITQINSKKHGTKKKVKIEIRKKKTYAALNEENETPEKSNITVTNSDMDASLTQSDLAAPVKENDITHDASDLDGETDATQAATQDLKVPSELAPSDLSVNSVEKNIVPTKPIKQDKAEQKVKSTKNIEEKDEIESKKNESKLRVRKEKNKLVKVEAQRAMYEALEENDDLDGLDAQPVVPQEAKIVPKKNKVQLRSNLLKKHRFSIPKQPKSMTVVLSEQITVSELAKQLSEKGSVIIKHLMKLGMMVNINQSIDQETATLVVEELGHTVKIVQEDALEQATIATFENLDFKPVSRAPIVTIMGHVDHGKTSLLDYIRRTKIASNEHGGITQHMGAYHVETQAGGQITFIDTPGHAAFTAMRARGAQITDIVVLVVAADDGVKPQTLEAIQHAKAANVPLIVAVNKMDKQDADLDRIKTGLLQHDVLSEDWGGEVQFVSISAKTGEGIETLLESIVLLAEIQELFARDQGPAEGIVLESRLDRSQGIVATLLIQRGALSRGDVLLAGIAYGRVRAMKDESNHILKQAGPSIPVQVLGLMTMPQAGDKVFVLENERKSTRIKQISSRKGKKCLML